jgi:uncharacterized phage protein (TIGR02218 family)
MKVISPALQAHLAGQVTTTTDLVLVTRRDGARFGFTTHDNDIEFGGVTYYARSIDTSAVQSRGDMSVDNLDIQVSLAGPDVTEAGIRAGLWDGATVQLSRVNYADLTQGALQLRRGELGQVSYSEGVAAAEFRGLTRRLENAIVETYTPTCRYDLGDSRCGVNLTSYTATGTVTGVTDRAAFTASALSGADDLYTFGKLTWTAGANAGLSMEIKRQQVGGVITLALPMPYAIAAGDTFSAVQGCNKLLKTSSGYTGDCKVKFSNVVRFGGFAEVPGPDKVLQRGKN